MKCFCWFVLFFLINIFSIANAQLVADVDTVLLSKQEVAVDTHLLQLPSISNNQFLNLKATPRQTLEQERQAHSNDAIFYLLLTLSLFFGVLRTVFSKYFNNLFRVFFNSSLRQSQLTDQLIQGQLPSLLFNMLFIFNAGLFLYFKLIPITVANQTMNWRQIGFFTLGLGVVYGTKFLSVRFSGWLTGQRIQSLRYLFIVFLINKIAGIALLPIVFVMAFASSPVANIFGWLGVLVLALLFAMRLIRCFDLMRQQVKMTNFQFLLYVVALEILPLCLLYKVIVNYLN